VYRGISEIKKGYQPRTNTVKDEKGDLVTDYHRILVRWRKHFSEMFNVHWVNNVQQTNIHTAESLVSEPSAFEFAMVIDKLQGKHLSDMFTNRKGLKQGDNLSPLLSNFDLGYAISRVQVIQEGLELNGIHQLLVYANDENILGGSVYTIKKNA
jgi:hypothetical protein